MVESSVDSKLSWLEWNYVVMIFYHSDTVQLQPHSRPISLKTHHVNTTEEY